MQIALNGDYDKIIHFHPFVGYSFFQVTCSIREANGNSSTFKMLWALGEKLKCPNADYELLCWKRIATSFLHDYGIYPLENLYAKIICVEWIDVTWTDNITSFGQIHLVMVILDQYLNLWAKHKRRINRHDLWLWLTGPLLCSQL